MKLRISLFLSGMLQVMLVSMNVIFISHNYIICMMVTGFLISYTWTYNTRKINVSTQIERLCYALGACTGTGVGYTIAKNLINLI